MRMGDATVIYQLPNGCTIAALLPEYAVESAKRNGRTDSMPVVAVVRPKRGFTDLEALSFFASWNAGTT